MFDWFSDLNLFAQIGGVAVVSAWILKVTGLLKIIRKWFEDAREAVKKPMFNLGVLITDKGNGIKFIGTFWETLIEPVIILVLELVPGIVFEICSSLTEGMKSDNKEFKK